MIKNFICGYIVGALSLIPGFSADTALLILNKFDEFIYKISHIFDSHHPNRKKDLLFIIYILIGIILGAITFARIVEFLFMYYELGTIFLLIGFIIFSLPFIYTHELKGEKLNLLFFFIGIIIIAILNNIDNNTYPVIIKNFPKITIIFLIFFSVCGFIDGVFTIFPGISGSMILMILGPYYLYKSYLAGLSINNISFLLPLSVYLISDLIGIYYGSKISLLLLNKSRSKTISAVLGMIIMSIFSILPNEINYNIKNICIITSSLLISYIITKAVNK